MHGSPELLTEQGFAALTEILMKAKELLKIIDKKLKKASHKNVLHKNAASRRVSVLTKRLNKKINEAV